MWWFGIPGLEDGMKPAFSVLAPESVYGRRPQFLQKIHLLLASACYFVKPSYNGALFLAAGFSHPLGMELPLSSLLSSLPPFIFPAIFFVLSPFSFSPIEREKGKGCYRKVLFFCLNNITKFDLGGERGPFCTSRRACHCNCITATIPTATYLPWSAVAMAKIFVVSNE
ncbi:hypothetical protein D5086_026035 [Populus alba]|uniref:Uncharacterized protein n=1 Tax=Populus alba TaxID=43335 RepID=A0ACC4B1B7_POPAL